MRRQCLRLALYLHSARQGVVRKALHRSLHRAHDGWVPSVSAAKIYRECRHSMKLCSAADRIRHQTTWFCMADSRRARSPPSHAVHWLTIVMIRQKQPCCVTEWLVRQARQLDDRSWCINIVALKNMREPQVEPERYLPYAIGQSLCPGLHHASI